MKKQFLISCLCFSVISISVLLLPLAGNGENNIQIYIGYGIGILFWLGLQELLLILNCMYKIENL